MSADSIRAGAENGQQARRQSTTCAAPSCWRDAEAVRVEEHEAVLCETHRKAFLGVSS